MKILVSADWHLDSAFSGKTDAPFLRACLNAVPRQIAELCRQQQCDLVLLPGDLFEEGWSMESLRRAQAALASMEVPVFIAPGNHDFFSLHSPWMQKGWPENVHIFRQDHIEAVEIPGLDCCVYGGAFTAMDCPALLEGFQADSPRRWNIGILHGDPTQVTSPYNPVTPQRIRHSRLDLLALGHIHLPGQVQGEKTLCLWPGCPMGRGYDETGERGVFLVTLTDTAGAEFLPLNTPRFYDWEVPGEDAERALGSLLPAAAFRDHYRITFTGESEGVDIPRLQALFSRFPNLTLRDRTAKPADIWASLGSDSLEGIYFGLLQQQLADADEDTRRRILLAAKLSRRILDGQEVTLP